MKYKILLTLFFVFISINNIIAKDIEKGTWYSLSWGSGTQFMIVPQGYIVKFEGGYNSSMVFIEGKIPEEWEKLIN